MANSITVSIKYLADRGVYRVTARGLKGGQMRVVSGEGTTPEDARTAMWAAWEALPEGV